MQDYKDMLAKAKFYKKEILQSFIKKGYFPSTEEINNALSDIDLRSALLETYMSKEGSLFNTKEINYMFECIYKDLIILYEILEDILSNEFNKLKLDVEAQVLALESRASELNKRMNEEINTSLLGTTLYFKSRDWNIEVNDDISIIDLGKIDLLDSSKIALFANINNIEPDGVYFTFKNNDNYFEALPYNYNEDLYVTPGKEEINTYNLSINGKLKVNDNLTIELPEVNPKNNYKIIGGNYKMFVTDKNSNERRLVDFANVDNSFYAETDCYIEFYLLDNTSITYDFNKRPNHTNFPLNDGTIVSSDKITKVFIDAPAGFTCRFKIETGEVWASCEDGVPIDNKNLQYCGDWSLRDFRILEFVKTNISTYDTKLIIRSNENIIPYIDCVYIKEVE